MSLILKPFPSFFSVFVRFLLARISVNLKLSKVFLAVLLSISLGFTSNVLAQGNFSSTGTGGNWSSNSSWTLVSGADGDGVPDANDAVTILGNDIITVDVASACTSLQIGGIAAPGGPGLLNFAGAFSLTVSGSVLVGGEGVTTRSGSIIFSSGATLPAANFFYNIIINYFVAYITSLTALIVLATLGNDASIKVGA